MHRIAVVQDLAVALVDGTAPARVLDVAGHEARTDVFQLRVRRAPMPPVVGS